MLLSFGGFTYKEESFATEQAAIEAGNKIWTLFGPANSSDTTLRPFGGSILDGFDFDFESPSHNMAAFANRLRELMKASKEKTYYLSSTPQCVFPDANMQTITNNVNLDFLNVQFYNNPSCGL